MNAVRLFLLVLIALGVSLANLGCGNLEGAQSRTTPSASAPNPLVRLEIRDGAAHGQGLIDARPTREPSELLSQLLARLPAPELSGASLQDGQIRARSSGSWSRFPVTYSLQPGLTPTVGAPVAMAEPLACYVSDAAVRFMRTWNFPEVDGTYTYSFDWVGPPGSPRTTMVLVYTLENANTPDVHSILKRTVTINGNSSPPQTLSDINAAITTIIWGETFLLGAGGLGTLPDSRVETEAMGTWVVNEDMNGVQDLTGTFDLRHVALKNMRAEPGKFNPSQTVPPPPGSTTRLRADVKTMPLTSELFPNGWSPVGNVTWRLAVFNDAGLVRTFAGEAPAHPREEDGRVASIDQVWDGHPEEGSLALVAPGSYDFGGQALAALGGAGQSITRPALGTVTVGNLAVEIKGLGAHPDSLDPSEEGATVNVTADVVANDFERPAGNYTMTIKPKSEEISAKVAANFVVQAAENIDPGPSSSPLLPPVRTFTGNLTFTGDTAKVSEAWDGKSDAGATFPEGDYEIELTVLVTEAGGGDPKSAQGFAQVTVGKAMVEFLQDGQPVQEVRPSYLWHVNQGEDVRIPPGAPDPRNEPGWQPGFPSVVEIRATLTSQPRDKTFPYNVTLIATPIPDLFRGAGHAHDGTGGRWPPGMLLDHFPLGSEHRILNDQVMSKLAASTTIQLTMSGLNQPASAWWVAPVAAGGVRFTFEAGSGFGGVTQDLPIRVEGLQDLGPALVGHSLTVMTNSSPQSANQTAQDVILTGAVPEHPDNHWCTDAFIQKLTQLARGYRNLTGRCVWYNDTSLRYGGKFDISGNLAQPNAHFEHRFGDIVDCTTQTLFTQQNQAFIRDAEFEKAARKEKLGIYWEVNHYHLRLRRGP